MEYFNTFVFRLEHIGERIVDSHDNDFGARQALVGSQYIHKIKAVLAWHVQIKNNDVRTIGFYLCNAGLDVGALRDLYIYGVLFLQGESNYIPRTGIIIDNQNFLNKFAHKPLRAPLYAV